MAALGLRRCKRWGYWTALAILTINLASDTTMPWSRTMGAP